MGAQRWRFHIEPRAGGNPRCQRSPHCALESICRIRMVPKGDECRTDAGVGRKASPGTAGSHRGLRHACFLSRELYADFRDKFAAGFKPLMEVLAKVINLDQGRIKTGNKNIDWSETWEYDDDGFFHQDYMLVETSPEVRFTLLTDDSL